MALRLYYCPALMIDNRQKELRLAVTLRMNQLATAGQLLLTLLKVLHSHLLKLTTTTIPETACFVQLNY